MIGLLAVAIISKQLTTASVTIRVDSGPVQSFGGFGAGIASQTSTGWTTPATTHDLDLISAQVWGTNRFNTARLLMNPASYETPYNNKDFNDFYTAFVTSNRLPAAIRNGAKILVLGPTTIPAYMNDGSGFILDSQIPYYAAILADFILQFQQKTGWLINWTGILNEPTSSQPITFRLSQWPVMVKTLRQKLDSRGLQAVHILGPETSQASADNDDDDAGGILNAIAADPEAWADLDAVATHSYGVGANPSLQALTRGKPWWVTESGSLIEQLEFPGDTVQAATASARFLVDMNNGVSNWIYFLGTEFAKAPLSGLISYYVVPYVLTVLQKYYYLQQLSQAFDTGAVFRHCSSNIDGQMLWQSGPKPHVIAAVAKNPDNTYAVGVTNYTSSIFTNPSVWLSYNGNYTPASSTWMRTQGGYGQGIYSVSIVIPELAGVSSKTFRAYRSSSLGVSNFIGTYTMVRGTISIPQINSLELVTLRSTN